GSADGAAERGRSCPSTDPPGPRHEGGGPHLARQFSEVLDTSPFAKFCSSELIIGENGQIRVIDRKGNNRRRTAQYNRSPQA
ncbi:unnamed protein product, partial [Heterosigma akashiwo]